MIAKKCSNARTEPCDVVSFIGATSRIPYPGPLHHLPLGILSFPQDFPCQAGSPGSMDNKRDDPSVLMQTVIDRIGKRLNDNFAKVQVSHAINASIPADEREEIVKSGDNGRRVLHSRPRHTMLLPQRCPSVRQEESVYLSCAKRMQLCFELVNSECGSRILKEVRPPLVQ
jgi:hypothetical protein